MRARGGERQAASLLDPSPAIMLAIVSCASLVVLAQVAVLLWLSLFEGSLGDAQAAYGLDNFREVFGDPFTLAVILDTLVFAAVALAVALAFGIPAAWLVERTDLGGKTALVTAMTVGLLVPSYSSAMGWLFLLHPKVGLVNRWLAASGLHFDITTLLGMGWVEGLNLAPLAFVMTAAVFRAMDPALEEAAAIAGAGGVRTWLKVTLRLAWPGILAASIYIFTIGFAAFDVPAIIGFSARVYTFSSYLLALLNAHEGLPHYGTAAALSTSVLVMAGLLAIWYGAVQRGARRYAVVTGKAYRPRLAALGPWRHAAWAYVGVFLVLSKLLPIVVMLWVSLLPYLQLPSGEALSLVTLRNFRAIDWELVLRGLRNSGALMVMTPTVTLIVSFAFSWIVLRSRLKGRGLFDFIAFLPHAVPSILFGVGALLLTLFVVDKIVPIYGTIWLLLAVFTVGRLSYGTRMINSGLIQISRELDESAEMCGASTWAVCCSVLYPLLSRTMLYAWLWIALMTYREMTLAVFLTTYDNTTLPMLIWGQWVNGNQGQSAALSLVMLVGMTPVLALFWSFAQRRGAASEV
ncbi:MAG TPA: ABC transporter permease subunit [Stellaceae bacterium]|nr:ABC transporter permease subunit [Stellaceae bacterium]